MNKHTRDSIRGSISCLIHLITLLDTHHKYDAAISYLRYALIALI